MHRAIAERIPEGKRIAIGVYREREDYDKKVVKAAKLCNFAEVVVVDEGEKTEKRLLDMVEKGEVDAAVRGTARASKMIAELKRRGYEFVRIALLETFYGKLFLLSPVGVDEGKNLAEKIMIAEEAKKMALKLGMNDKVAFLAGGRLGDVGRSEEVDRTLAEAELLAKICGGVNREILLEDVEEDIMIPPNGIIGNYIFRAMCYLGGGREYGAYYAKLPFTLIDTSRAQSAEGYLRALALAAVMSE